MFSCTQFILTAQH